MHDMGVVRDRRLGSMALRTLAPGPRTPAPEAGLVVQNRKRTVNQFSGCTEALRPIRGKLFFCGDKNKLFVNSTAQDEF